ncbi:MAG: three-Cys-motif partner protein TcmP [Verrucomicrobiia bacterium]
MAGVFSLSISRTGFQTAMQSILSSGDGLPIRMSGEWAKRKHYFLKNYCGITTISMRNKFRLVYLDLMAGPGRCKIEDTNEEFSGSPLVALEHDFANYIFIEKDPNLLNALDERVSKHPKARKVKIIPDDWLNGVASGQLRFDASTLVVAFVDPIGISDVPLPAMQLLAENPRIDLLVTIQYRLGIVRNLPQYLRAVGSETALDNFLGDQNWREWKTSDFGEFGRRAVEYFCNKFKKDQGFIGTRHVSVPEQNPLYRFTLFTRHSRGEDFWNKILKVSETGQREFGI